MAKKFFDIENDILTLFNYRYIQPPQIAYFINTMDEFGNLNSTPVTLGTCNSANLPRGKHPAEFYLSFSLGAVAITDEGNQNHPRDGYINLLHSDEVVISYIPKSIMMESIVANLPFPRGISELDVAGLHSFDSKFVKVPSIVECPINIECKIINRIPLGKYYMMYVAKAVGLSVDQALIDLDQDGLGVFHINPIFEVNITKTEQGNIRLNYGEMDAHKISVPGDNFGSTHDWVGTFEHFVSSEHKRGKITEDEKTEILRLSKLFHHNRGNQELKNKLTALLKIAVGPIVKK